MVNGLDLWKDYEAFVSKASEEIASNVVRLADRKPFKPLQAPAEASRLILPNKATDAIIIKPTSFTWRDPKTIPPRDWLYGNHLARRHVSATIASGAVGKTSLMIVDALAMATGRNLVGRDVRKRLRVWLFNLEDDRQEMDRRLAAAMMFYNIKPEDIRGYLFVEAETPLIITETDHKGTKIRKPIVAGLTEAIKSNSIDVLIVDPFVSSHDVSENDNGAIDAVLKQGWIPVAREGDCAIDIAHHTTKSDASMGAATVFSARGGGSFIMAARSARVLNPMLEDEAKKAGLASHFGYFSSYNGKQNNSPQTGLRDWYKMEDVDLENAAAGNPDAKVTGGNLDFLHSDHVGVVTEFVWPTSQSFVDDVTKEELQGIQNFLRIGKFRKDMRSKDWAGHKVGEILKIDTANKANKQRVARMLETWIERGDLVEYNAQDKNRVKREYIRPPTDGD